MLWVKAFHLISIVCWFAGLLYLPRLFVYHAMTEDSSSKELFKTMERKLYWNITTPAMISTLVLGFWLLSFNTAGYMLGAWMHAKLAMVTILIVFHHMCGRYMKKFAADNNTRSHKFFRWFNEVPAMILVVIVVLVVVKPI